MKNLTQQIKITLLLSALVLLAFTVKAQNENYFVKHDGTVVKMHGEKARIDFYYSHFGMLYYTDENGKDAEMFGKNIKLLVFGKSIYMGLPSYEGDKKTGLHRIVAFNDKYILTGKADYNGGYIEFNILDRDFHYVSKKGISMSYGKTDKAKSFLRKRYEDNFALYFKDCEELHKACYNNIDDIKEVFENIEYYNCGSSTDLITNKPIDKNVKTQPVVEKEPIYFYVTTSGEKIIIEDNTKGGDQDFKTNRIAALNPNFKYNIGLSYFNGMPVYKSKTVPSKSIKYIFLSDKVFAPLTIKGYGRIVQIICFNNDFVFFYDNEKYQVYDRNISSVIEESKDGITPLLDKYFKDCTDLLKLIEENRKYHRNSLLGITYYNCNNSKDIVEGIEFE